MEKASPYRGRRLLDLIPEKELREKLSYGDCELDEGFLGFEYNYSSIANLLPESMVVVDMGCYQAAQCYFFKNFKRYIGVDYYDTICPSDSYIPPLRFGTANTTHYQMTIGRFLDEKLSELDLNNTYFISSAVPDFEETDRLFGAVQNCAIIYPGKPTRTKGVLSQEIRTGVLVARRDFLRNPYF